MDYLSITPSTELEAINSLLYSIGEHPINTLDIEETGLEALIAKDILHQTSRQVQAVGLHCNTEEGFPLVKDIEGYVHLPADTLKVDATDPNRDVVMRGKKLYDRQKHSFIFNEDKIEVDLTRFLDFNDLPQVVKDYIIIRAVRVFQSRILGSETLYQFTLRDEAEARILMFQEEVDTGDYNMLNNSDIQSMLRRN